MQVVCKPCHKGVKTKEENLIRKGFSQLIKLHPREYQSWSNMNQRCNNPKATGYAYYGGKGIKVHEGWLRGNGVEGFKSFIKDMGDRPDGCTLDRIDFTGDYTPDNCRWASHVEQARNTSWNNWLEYNGDILILQEWADKLNIKSNTILTRLRRGWAVGQALGLEERPKKLYIGRLTPDDLIYIKEKTEEGHTQTEIGKVLEIDSSQISRIISKLYKNNNKAS